MRLVGEAAGGRDVARGTWAVVSGGRRARRLSSRSQPALHTIRCGACKWRKWRRNLACLGLGPRDPYMPLHASRRCAPTQPSLSPLQSSSLATASVVYGYRSSCTVLRRQRERSASGGATEANSGEVAESSVGVTWGARCAGGGTTPSHAVSEAPRPARVLACSRSADRPSTQLQRRRSNCQACGTIQRERDGPRRPATGRRRGRARPQWRSVAPRRTSGGRGSCRPGSRR